MSTTNREFKGKSLLQCVDSYVVVDIETTGLDPKYDEIIEIGAIRIKNQTPISSFNSLVRPYFPISDFITTLTGITNEMLSSAPSFEDVAPSFLSFVEDSIIVGHNVNFDINFLYDCCMRDIGVLLDNNFIDTLRLSRRIIPGLPNYKLDTLANAFDLTVSTKHRALADCDTTHRCYEHLKQYVHKNHIDLEVLCLGFSRTKAREINTCKIYFDESHILYQKVCVFTGALDRFTRKEAMQAVVDAGGICGDSINRHTNFLVVGNLSYCKSIHDGKSGKMKKAEEYILKGYDLQIISESVFYDMLG
ncbi:exonuclease domain-containing protein [Anaeromassilibacillus senegalensis]|uniref:exonuclease domain-containing protein n=1 Tax=Anaeromassilibacillus senegalensis TaxID=1673717 RepID=UPI000682CC5F|nr:exonuclease domain-containing protein [Anaeromassilibacillus senegalensis]